MAKGKLIIFKENQHKMDKGTPLEKRRARVAKPGNEAPSDGAMEALEAQRFLQTTLPRFLDNIDDSFKVPFNFKVWACTGLPPGTLPILHFINALLCLLQLGDGNPTEREEAAMLVPLGSFNPVPKILRAIQSDDLESERAALQADCDNMDQAMQIIVDGSPPPSLY
jgi:hypothetical protein